MRRASALVAAGALLVGCTAEPASPTPTAMTPTATRDFTVITTEAPTTYDPAAATTSADAIVALNTFSRLMVVHPDGAELKPDLATDCLYTLPTVYQCTLPKNLTFHNGHALTASDVKFSIERAYRLWVAQSSVSLLDSLQRVQVVDDLTVRFELKWADSQFGYALATPVASIVDEEIYDPDAARPNTGQPIGSGPYQLVTTADDQLVFELNENYKGALTGKIPRVRLRFVADSAAAEAEIAAGTTDVVWRGLAPAALERLAAEMAENLGVTKSGFRRIPMPRVRLNRLIWNPTSPHRMTSELRGAVAASLQADRSLASLIPPSVEGAVDSFAAGGVPTIPTVPGTRVRLTLSYSSRAPGMRDLAGFIRDRLEDSGGVSVQLVADADADADLILTDRSAWVNTAFGWLQPYADDPLPGSSEKIGDLDRKARETTDAVVRDALLAEIQEQAAVDLTILPISASQETFFLGKNASLEGYPFGPGYQLGLWSLRA